MTLRFRLTFWYTLLLAVVLLLFAVGFQAVVARALYGEVDDMIQSQAERVVAVFEANIDPMRSRLPIPAIVFASQVFAQASTLQGTVIDKSPGMGDQMMPLPEEMRERNLAGESGFYTWQGDGVTLRVFSTPVHSPEGQVVATVQVARSLDTIDSMLKIARLALLVGGGIAVALAAIGGALISSAALRPLNQIADTTSRIVRAEDLDQRIEGVYPDDEVGQLASTFNEMMGRLQDLFNTQQRLVADVSHELRTPLATIQGNVDLLQRGAAQDPAMLSEGLEAIGHEVARMTRLVRDLLLLAETDAGVRLILKPVELDTLLLEVYREALLMADGRVRVRLGHEDQAQVQGEPDRLKQLLLNLISNAIAYTPPGGLVTLSLHRRPDGWVRVTVADTGVGIAPEDLPHIFDRFWRVDRARGRAAGSSGLGLSIAQSIAEAHGGSISVESKPGQGSTFEVLLPL
ncbi:MAG: HAMP domain-containing protein [Anaerolinea sp.]|nr:HAMP domain-containing protein [Anaerolinea sp.]